ncbi:MAG: carboxypeptidase regulatory-like domain-containing protein [Bacteroidia bacterium]|nr:carboxypeptidase regulatory-like domain-containing protein [Bacteroidia bacterium]
MKRPNSKHIYLLLLSFLVMFTHCSDPIDTSQPQYKIELGDEIVRTVTGTVYDFQGNPLPNATVNVMGSETTTDEQGLFVVPNASVFKRLAYVTVEKSGFFQGSRSFFPTSGINEVSIRLLKKESVGTIDTDLGGSVEFEDVKLEMGAGFQTAQGASYTGDVQVFASYIDPTSEHILEEMPGSLRGVGPDGEDLLATYGMLAVELEDAAGNSLQLAPGNSSTITMPIPPQLAGISPSTIPLWHFDQEAGYWVEDGEAKKVGNTYVGSVSHFSFWNIDIKVEATEAYANVVTTSGRPVPKAFVQMSGPGVGSRGAYTGDDGGFGGLMPANLPMDVTISCDLLEMKVFRTTVTVPTSGELNNFVIPDEYFPPIIDVSGQVVDCDGNPAPDVYLILNGNKVLNTQNGRFTYTLAGNRSYRVQPVNYLEASKANEVQWVLKDENTDVGDIPFCDVQVQNDVFIEDVKEFMAYYTIDGTTYMIRDGFEVSRDSIFGRFILKLGSAASNGAGGKLLYLAIKKNFKTSLNGNVYFHSQVAGGTFDIDFTTGNKRERRIVPIDIQIRPYRADIHPGGKGILTFEGTFREWDPDLKQYVDREVKNGNISYELN